MGTVAQRHCDLVEQRHGDDIFGIGRGIGVKPDGVEDIPRRHLAGVVHARQRQSFGSHAVEPVQNVVEQLLRTLLTADEVIQVRETVVGLVAVAVLPDKTRKVVHLVALPRNREELVQLRPERLAAGIETDQPLGIVRREERLLPSVGFAVHVFVIGILVVEGRDPRAVVEPSAHQARRGVEEVLVIGRALHQHIPVRPISQHIGQQRHGIVVVGVFERFRNRGFAYGLRHGILDIHFGDIAAGDILVEPRADRPLHGGVAQDQLVGAAHVETADAAQVHSGHERRSVVAVEEGRHESAPLFAPVGVRADDVGRDIGSQQAEQNQLVAVIVPIRRPGVITEPGIDDLAVRIGKLAVHVAAQRGPEERAVKA